MIRTYRYFGNSTIEATDVVLKKFGQEYKITDQVALDLLARNGGPILLSEDFPKAGFSPSHISDRRERKPTNESYMTAHRRAMELSRELKKFLEQQVNGSVAVAQPEAAQIGESK